MSADDVANTTVVIVERMSNTVLHTEKRPGAGIVKYQPSWNAARPDYWTGTN